MAALKYPYQNLSLKNIEREKWEDIPSLDGAYELSNFGRVKSRRRFVEPAGRGGFWTKDRILKLRVKREKVLDKKRRIYRLTASISFEGKRTGFPIARMVYFLFVKKFDLENPKLVVSVKDEDPFNICPENLMLISPSVFMKRAYDKNRRKRECYGNKPIQISQFDFNGNWINTYSSISAASRLTGIGSSSIAEVLTEERGFANGYIWRYGSRQKELLKIPETVTKKLDSDKLHSTAITQYDASGKKVKQYKNLKAAAKAVGAQPNSIRNVILNHSLSAKNSYWIAGRGAEQISMQDIEKRKRERKNNVLQPVTQYDLKGKKLGTYISIAEAARALKISLKALYSALRKPGEYTSGGFLWLRGDGPATIKINPSIKRTSEQRLFHLQKVSQYNHEGIRIKIHDSLKQASAILNLSLFQLVQCVIGKSHSHKGFYWRLGGGPAKIQVSRLTSRHQSYLQKASKPVVQYTAAGKRIKEYNSITAASKATNTSTSQIKMVAAGKYPLAKGFSWKFK